MPNGTTIRIQLETPSNETPAFSFPLSSNKYRILMAAYHLFQKGESVVFVSKDLTMRVKGEALGLEVEDYENQKFSYDGIYRGYQSIDLTKNQIDHFFKDGRLSLPETTLLPNEYALLSCPEQTSAVGKYDGKSKEIVSLLPIESPIWGISPLNIEQRCAMDLLLRDEVKLVTLIGPAGTGKTLLARAVAGEAGVPFLSISGSEFVELFVGAGASRVRDLFQKAKAAAPSIIFIDEIDAVGRRRGVGLGGGNDEREQTLNQILVEMDGFETGTNVIVIAATNRADVLDPALLRPGRFDRRVTVEQPDAIGREEILRVHAHGKLLQPDVDLASIAKLTVGFTGADLENLLNEAGILAARRGAPAIGTLELTEAFERIFAGPERARQILSPEERRVVAYHEAGHALVMESMPTADPVHKISIVSRGSALGYTMPLPERDKVLRSKEAFEAEIAGLLGGRAAEELNCDGTTTGAANDLERATAVARAMVTKYGMSDELGLRTFGNVQSQFPDWSPGQRDYAEGTALRIDAAINGILQGGYERAKAALTERWDAVRRVATALLEQEVLERADIERLLATTAEQAPVPCVGKDAG